MRNRNRIAAIVAIVALALVGCRNSTSNPDPTLTGIAVTTPPDKIEYTIGEPFAPAGMVVTATYDDGSTTVVPNTDLEITGFNSATAGARTVTVTYREKTATFAVTVVDGTTEPTYGISLSAPVTHAFAPMQVGYTAASQLSVTVTNTGNRVTGALDVALSGTNASSFALSAASLPSIAAPGTAVFTVAPIPGLEVGTYAATVTVSGGNGITASFGVSFAVTEGAPPPIYGISLDAADIHTFDPQYVDYGAVEPLSVTVTNTGNRETGALDVALSGTNASSFALSVASLPSIAAPGTALFTVGPLLGLEVGTHTATVTVSGENGISASFGVTFTVNAPVITIGTHPEATTTVTYGSITGNLTVAATVTGGGSVDWQWFSATENSNSDGTAIADATSASFVIPEGLEIGTHFFFAEASSVGATAVRSDVAAVTVEPVSITSAAVTGVTAPVTLEVPSTVASGAGDFTVGQVVWNPADNPFQGGTAYTATVTLTADANHTFAGGLTGTVTINGNPALVIANNGTAATLSYTFPATEWIPITSAAITVTAPVWSQVPDMAASGTGEFTVGQVAWTPADNPFQGGTVYTVTVILTANANHAFAAGLAGAATVNGNPASVTDNDGTTATLSYTFPATEIVSHVVPAAGEGHSLTIRADGSLWAWGHGGLGDGTTTQRLSPVQIQPGTTWVSVSAGGHTLGIQADGSLWAWGSNWSGQLGDGTTTWRTSPVQVQPGTTWVSVAAGEQHSLGIRADGSLWTWGDNTMGQLGDGTTTQRLSPVQIQPGTTWVSVATGGRHSLGIRADGSLWAWGDNTMGQLYDDPLWTDNHLLTNPVQVQPDTTWVSVAAGGRTMFSEHGAHTLGIRADGTLWAWGNNNFGQLGDGTTIFRTSPVQVQPSTTWVSVSTRGWHSLGIRADGSLWAWGHNGNGQLGDGTSGWEVNRTSPVQVQPGTTWVSVSAGGGHTLGIRADGSLWAWGHNSGGQLGDGTWDNQRTSPVQVQPGTP